MSATAVSNPGLHAPSPRRERRSRLYVNGRVQGNIIRYVLFYWAAYHVVLWHLLFLHRYVQYRGEVLAGARPTTFWDLYSRFAQDHVAVVLCALPILPVLLWDVLRVTHRVAGPLVRFQACLRSLARGEYVPFVRIRKGDYLGDLEQAFNEYLATLPEPESEPASPAPGRFAPTAAGGTAEAHTPVYISCGEPACDPDAETLVGPTDAEIQEFRSAAR